jgi:hypothetical protein
MHTIGAQMSRDQQRRLICSEPVVRKVSESHSLVMFLRLSCTKMLLMLGYRWTYCDYEPNQVEIMVTPYQVVFSKSQMTMW